MLIGGGAQLPVHIGSALHPQITCFMLLSVLSLADGSLPHSPSSPFIRLQSSATQAHPSSSSSSTTPKVLRTHEQTQQQPGKDVTEADGALGGVDGTPAGSVVVDPKGGSSTGGAKASRWRAGHSCLPSLVVLSSDDEAEVGGQVRGCCTSDFRSSASWPCSASTCQHMQADGRCLVFLFLKTLP